MPRIGSPPAHTHAGAGVGGQLDWDQIFSDAVHLHSAAAEGGTLDWDSIFSDAVHSHASDAEGGVLPAWPRFIVSGRYYMAPPMSRLVAQQAPGADVLWLTPALFPEAVAIDRLADNVLVAVASGAFRLGYYTDVDGVPTALVVDSGEIAAATTGEKAATVAVTLGPGLYWRALLCNSGTLEFPCSNSGPTVGGSSRSGAADNLALSAVLAYAALPATCPAATGEQNRAFAGIFRVA